jgi:hypothetical protein
VVIGNCTKNVAQLADRQFVHDYLGRDEREPRSSLVLPYLDVHIVAVSWFAAEAAAAPDGK